MHSILKTSLAALVAAGVTATAASADGHALSGELNITSDMSNPAPRAVMEKLAADFDAMHDDLTVNLTIVDREAWKTQIRNALGANPPDVVNWYAATRMTPYVDAGLFMDISDLWAEPEMAGLASTKGAMTLDGKQWGVPYTYYQWGVYYRKDIYEELGLSEPATWEEELANCQTINPDVAPAEDAPTDTFHIASGAQNVPAAKAFLTYVTSPDVQTWVNAGDALGQLPVNAEASISDDKFIQEGFEMLSNNASGGIMQFFDRDFPAEMASVGMEGLQEFMVFPDNLDDILERLEEARQRIYQ